MKTVYTFEDKKWFLEELKKLKDHNIFNFPGLRDSGFVEKYCTRFKKQMNIEAIMSLLKRIDDPESSKKQYQKYKETEKLRKQGLLPSRSKTGNTQNIGDLLSKYPFIIVIDDKVAGYENEEQVKKAITDSQISTNLIKMFEIKERKIKAQLSIEIE